MNKANQSNEEPGSDNGRVAESPVSFKDVLAMEKADIMYERSEVAKAEHKSDNDYETAPLTGLALSGGGIRSATFNLGVIQALAELRLLRRFDYLSTVSGGGYIGSWLSSWMASHGQTDGSEPPEDQGRWSVIVAKFTVLFKSRPDQEDAEITIIDVEKAIAPEGEHGPVLAAGLQEPPPLRHLRSYTDYLKPHGGLFSLDAVTAFTTWLRNTLLNQLILVAFFGMLLLLPLITGWLVNFLGWSVDKEFAAYAWLRVVSVVLLAVAIAFINLNLVFKPAATGSATVDEHGLPWYSSSRSVIWLIISPLTACAFLISLTLPGLGTLVSKPGGGGRFIAESWSELIHPFVGIQVSGGIWVWLTTTPVGFLALILTANLMAFLISMWLKYGQMAFKKADRRDSSMLIFSAVFFAAAVAGAALLPFIAKFMITIPDFGDTWRTNAILARTILCGTPLIMLAFVAATFVYVGLMGREFDEHQREWWSRLIALITFVAVAWFLLFGLSLWGPMIVEMFKLGFSATITWLGASGIGVLLAKNITTVGERKNGNGLIARLVVRIIPYIFILGLCLVVIYWLNITLLNLLGYNSTSVNVAGFFREPYTHRLAELQGLLNKESGVLWAALGILGLIVGVLTWRVDINVFSFHGFYRNRLTRAYLAAGLPPGVRDTGRLPLTGMNDRDSPKLTKLQKRPYHILNTAINITSSKHLSWQERKAASFFFSKRYCGYWLPGSTYYENYCKTRDYLSTTKYGRTTRHGWISLNVPMTISGAAVSPNAGYHTSPALAFLMTVFNVRLGWWMQNSASMKNWSTPGPIGGLEYLLSELIGSVDESKDFIYLSDGGHFENLGIYELVHRKCKFILACDAGADPNYEFEDLGNVIRKCYIDQGVVLDIDVSAIRPQTEKSPDARSKSQFAIGYIFYPKEEKNPGTQNNDSQNDEKRMEYDEEPGVLLYIKSSMSNREATDIEQYKAAHKDFPHDPTTNQFFTESQFESYRKLGYTLCRRAFSGLNNAKSKLRAGLEEVREGDVRLHAIDIMQKVFGEYTVSESDWTNFSGSVENGNHTEI